MALSGYDTGDMAVQQIAKMYGIRDIPFAKAYIISNHTSITEKILSFIIL